MQALHRSWPSSSSVARRQPKPHLARHIQEHTCRTGAPLPKQTFVAKPWSSALRFLPLLHCSAGTVCLLPSLPAVLAAPTWAEALSSFSCRLGSLNFCSTFRLVASFWCPDEPKWNRFSGAETLCSTGRQVPANAAPSAPTRVWVPWLLLLLLRLRLLRHSPHPPAARTRTRNNTSSTSITRGNYLAMLRNHSSQSCYEYYKDSHRAGMDALDARRTALSRLISPQIGRSSVSAAPTLRFSEYLGYCLRCPPPGRSPLNT